jgi:hypothetical protein
MFSTQANAIQKNEQNVQRKRRGNGRHNGKWEEYKREFRLEKR